MYDDIIKYRGCISVRTSMRSLEPIKRSEVAKESINRLCRANNIALKNGPKPNNDTINRMLGDQPDLLDSGTEVRLEVTSTHLLLLRTDNEQIIRQHEMPNVSFASHGEDETFVAYVAKDNMFGRACFVLECSCQESGRNVLDSIARAFKLRTKQILYNSGTLPAKLTSDRFNNRTNNNGSPSLFHSTDFQDTSLDAAYKMNSENDRNGALIAATRASLSKEPWFHGSNLSREESETRLNQEGDFLVRESIWSGHFVLTVMHNGTKLHLLFDSMGQVKTKEMVFDDVSHLIRYHHDQGLPIVAENRIVYLRNAVRPTKPIPQ